MKTIGITGGIGSGKSTVCRIFEVLEVPCYNADDRAKALMHESHEVRLAVEETFGDDLYPGGVLNRQKLAAIVFNNPEKLDKLNQIVHPAVGKDFKMWLEQRKHHSLLIKEAALLFESGTYKDLDYIVTVTAPLETRISRIMQRDQCSREAVMERIKNQWDEPDKVAKSNAVIVNDGNTLLLPQVIELFNSLTNRDIKSEKSI